MPFFEADQHKIFYADTGSEKPVLVFSDGFFAITPLSITDTHFFETNTAVSVGMKWVLANLPQRQTTPTGTSPRS